MAKKITRATVKSFIKKNNIESLFLSVYYYFDGMIDGLTYSSDSQFKQAVPTEDRFINQYNMGIEGVHILPSGSSGNSITAYDDGTYEGYSICNCCRSFIIAKKK